MIDPSAGDDDASLAERVARLEALVEELRRAQAPAASGPPAAVLPAADPPRTRTARLVASIPWDGEFWLNKLGIGLVLFGVAFLFRYSIDQGWLTPAVRVGFGAALGTALLAAGLRMGTGQRRFVSVLLGGGVATYYITGFAAFQLYALLGYTAAFVLMGAVTLLTYALSVRREEPTLALVGAIGGLGTPFLLYSGSGRFAGVVVYTCLMLGWTSALYLWRGWRSVLWASVVGGWLVFWTTYLQGVRAGTMPGDAWVLQGAVLFACVALWLVPAWRELRVGPSAPRAAMSDRAEALHVYLLALATPLLALLLTRQLWAMPNVRWGGLVLAVALLLAGVAVALKPRNPPLAGAHLLAAAVLLPVGTFAALEQHALQLALAAEAAALHVLARRAGSRALTLVAHAIAAVCAVWLAGRLVAGGDAAVARMAADLAVVGLAFAASFALRARDAMLGYRFFAHFALLAWLWRALAGVPHAAAWVSVAWGAYGIALLLLALSRRSALLQRVAIGTLLLVVAKLFLFDLAALEALWRVLLFLGLGGVFLALSYALQSLWREGAGPR